MKIVLSSSPIYSSNMRVVGLNKQFIGSWFFCSALNLGFYFLGGDTNWILTVKLFYYYLSVPFP